MLKHRNRSKQDTISRKLKALRLKKDPVKDKPAKDYNLLRQSEKITPAKKHVIIDRTIEYCLKFYNQEADGDLTALKCATSSDEDHSPILYEEFNHETAIKALKKEKSARVNPFLPRSHKRDFGKQCRPRSDAEDSASDQDLHCLH